MAVGEAAGAVDAADAVNTGDHRIGGSGAGVAASAAVDDIAGGIDTGAIAIG